MNRFELTKEALADIDELWDYIAEDNLDAANRVSDAILDACALLASQPLIGHARQDLTTRSVLFWSSGKYLIVYRPDTEPLHHRRLSRIAGRRRAPRRSRLLSRSSIVSSRTQRPIRTWGPRCGREQSRARI